MIRFFQAFVAKMKAGFARIARATKHEVTVDDLHNDAWVMALEIGERRGKPIDFSDPADQDLVMAALYVENVRRGDWQMRKSMRIDYAQERGEGEGMKVVERLPALELSDPLLLLLAREAALKHEEILVASYSQAAAYVMVFVRFKNDRRAVRSYLVISNTTLAKRVTDAANTVRAQPSLFDRIERIEAHFMPLRGKQYLVKTEQNRDTVQWRWEFEEGESRD